MTEIFKFKDHSYNLRKNNCIERQMIISCKYGSETVLNLGAKLWDILLENIKKLNLLRILKRKQDSFNNPCKLCKTCIANVGCV